jgi:hypothetical protein
VFFCPKKGFYLPKPFFVESLIDILYLLKKTNHNESHYGYLDRYSFSSFIGGCFTGKGKKGLWKIRPVEALYGVFGLGLVHFALLLVFVYGFQP